MRRSSSGSSSSNSSINSKVHLQSLRYKSCSISSSSHISRVIVAVFVVVQIVVTVVVLASERAEVVTNVQIQIILSRVFVEFCLRQYWHFIVVVVEVVVVLTDQSTGYVSKYTLLPF